MLLDEIIKKVTAVTFLKIQFQSIFVTVCSPILATAPQRSYQMATDRTYAALPMVAAILVESAIRKSRIARLNRALLAAISYE